MFRNVLRFWGLACLLAIYVASGLQKVTNPTVPAALLADSNFPRMLSWLGVTLTAKQYVYLIYITGTTFLSFSAFILLGVGRSFFAFLLAAGTALITVAFYVNLDNPSQISEENGIHIMKNVSVIGGLLFVAGSGRSHSRYLQARKKEEQDKEKRE